jgi:ectoine hydroxylase-related dioxygenase (phytanoyl-CoA dioxygenase family)
MASALLWSTPLLTAGLHVHIHGAAVQGRGCRCSVPLLIRQDPPRIIPAEAAAADASALCDALDAHGVVRVNEVLSARTADTVLSYVNRALDEALLRSRDEFVALESGDLFGAHFGKVLSRRDPSSGATRRHDLKLSLTPPVSEAVVELLSALGPTIAQSLGEDAVLYELAALISDPGSPQQPFHPDTRFRDDQGVAVLTAFVALQPVDERMGPTQFLPASHTADAHAAFNTRDDGSRAFHALLRSRPTYRGLLGRGDATLFDSRLLHCGGGNESPRRRVLFYASFRARCAKVPPGTLLYDMRDRHSLREWRHCWARDKARDSAVPAFARFEL